MKTIEFKEGLMLPFVSDSDCIDLRQCKFLDLRNGLCTMISSRWTPLAEQRCFGIEDCYFKKWKESEFIKGELNADL